MIEIFFYTFVLFTREIVTKDGGKGGGGEIWRDGEFLERARYYTAENRHQFVEMQGVRGIPAPGDCGAD